MGSSISVLLLAPDAWARGWGPWFTMPSVSCPVGRSHSCCRSVSCEVLAVILALRSGVALALALAWLLLRNCGSLEPRFLLPDCGGGSGPGLPGPARLDSSLLQSWCLGLGPGCLVCRLPSVSLPWVCSTVGFGFGLHFFGNGLPVLSRNSCRSFLGNLSLCLRLRLIPSLPRAPCIFMAGLCRKRGWECWSGSSSTSLRGS